MILNWLFFSLVVMVPFQPNAPRLFAAFCFVVVTVAHDLLLGDATGLLYYGSAALGDLAILILISGISPVPDMVIKLQQLCLAAMGANLFGWGLWFYKFPPTLYDLAFVALYIWALVILIKRTGDNVGGFTVDSWRSCVCFNAPPWYFNLFKNWGKV